MIVKWKESFIYLVSSCRKTNLHSSLKAFVGYDAATTIFIVAMIRAQDYVFFFFQN